ncbi:hypothetical protein ES703_95413 [subsurface metagenome]
MNPHCYGIMRSLTVLGSFQNEVGQLVGGVFAVSCYPTNNPVVPPSQS